MPSPSKSIANPGPRPRNIEVGAAWPRLGSNINGRERGLVPATVSVERISNAAHLHIAMKLSAPFGPDFRPDYLAELPRGLLAREVLANVATIRERSWLSHIEGDFLR